MSSVESHFIPRASDPGSYPSYNEEGETPRFHLIPSMAQTLAPRNSELCPWIVMLYRRYRCLGRRDNQSFNSKSSGSHFSFAIGLESPLSNHH